MTDTKSSPPNARSGLKLPGVPLGIWHNFGEDEPARPTPTPANPRRRLRCQRDELISSSKAGWDIWSGPFGNLGFQKDLTASLEQSPQRRGLEYDDIFCGDTSERSDDPSLDCYQTWRLSRSSADRRKRRYDPVMVSLLG